MPHPIDDIATKYISKVDELNNLDRQIASLEGLQKRKAELETELSELRSEMGRTHNAPAMSINRAAPNDLKSFNDDPHAAEK